MRRIRLRSILWRIFEAWLLSALVTAAALMGISKIRKLLRGDEATGRFPRLEPLTSDVGRGDVATTYMSGDRLYADMLAAIEGARERVLFETYIIKGDETGRRFKDTLVAAAQRGVDVRVVYDGFANLVVDPRFLRFPAPVKVLRYPVFNAGWQIFNPRRWGRDHRKILVVDDEVGFVGGYNIGALYEASWRDTHVRLRGDAVWDLANAFIDFWNIHRAHDKMPSAGSPTWQPFVRAHRNVPRQLVFPIRGMYLEAIDRASRHIRMTAAYFIPDHDILAALQDARGRGVEVDIIVPKVSNHVLADWLSRGFYGDLLRAGVRLHQYENAMVHAKTATIDGSWSTVGTANIDRLSLSGNYEINLEVIDERLARDLEEAFETDLGNCTELTLHEWQQRDVVARACEILLRPLRPLL
ncbi:phosphatidylserine/phosphatidylglycerophosphate/cardiolipin synthase family protein [Aeromicrobium sp. CTD01-1L150]|uniref:phospholipase D-like domain-containing protein n=1 Tax=Aeromicrobium sp. CTD01-1L150 TaxID=3341830 RepID=UPI0035C050AF